MARRFTRRRILGGGLAAAGLAALQACGGSGGGAAVVFITQEPTQPTPTPTIGPPPTPTPGPAARDPACEDMFSFVNKQRYLPDGCVPPNLVEIDPLLVDPML